MHWGSFPWATILGTRGKQGGHNHCFLSDFLTIRLAICFQNVNYFQLLQTLPSLFEKHIHEDIMKQILPFHKVIPPADITASAHRTVSSLYSRRLTRRTSILSFL